MVVLRATMVRFGVFVIKFGGNWLGEFSAFRERCKLEELTLEDFLLQVLNESIQCTIVTRMQMQLLRVDIYFPCRLLQLLQNARKEVLLGDNVAAVASKEMDSECRVH